MIVFNLIA